MKKILCIMLTVLVGLQSIFLISCEKIEPNPIDETKEYTFKIGRWEAAIAGEYALFPQRAVYNFCDEPMISALTIYNTALGNSEDNPLYSGSYYILDDNLTSENDGIPVFYAFQSYIKFLEDGKTTITLSEIIMFDMATNMGKTIIKDIPGNIRGCALYGDTLFFTLDEADEGWNLYAIGTDGKNLRKKDNPDKTKCGLETVYAGKVYYTIGGNKLYRCNLEDLSNPEYLFDAQGATMINTFVYGDYIYYAKNLHKVEFEKGSITAFDMYRRPLNDLEKDELFIKDITRGQLFDNMFYYYTADNSVIRPGTGDGNIKLSYDYGWGVLYGFNAETLETKEVYNIMGEEYATKYPLDATEDYIIFLYSEDLKSRHTVVLDLKTGEEKILPNTVIE